MTDLTGQALTTGEAIVETLIANGTDTVFNLPGAQIYALNDAKAKAERDGRLRVFGGRHEQTPAYMALGYAKATGRTGVFSVVPGPGILNASAAMLTAFGTNTPVLALTGDVTTHFKNRERGQLHEVTRQIEMVAPYTKAALHVEQPVDAPAMVAQGLRIAVSGRQGPVMVQAPWDVLAQRADYHPAAPVQPDPGPRVDSGAVAASAAVIRAARRPVIAVGSGALEAGPEVLALARHLNAPVIPFRGGRGVVDSRDPLGFNCAEGLELWQGVDCAIIIGSRFELMDLRWRHRPKGLKLVRIDIDPAEVRRLRCDANITGQAADGAVALLAELRGQPLASEWTDAQLAEARLAAGAKIRAITPQIQYLDALRAAMPEDSYLVEEISQVGFASIFGYPVYAPRQFVTAGYQGTLGFGFPTALGVKAAHPGKPVVSITGDGGFLFAGQELVTAVQYGLNLITVIFNNNAFGNVRRDQQNLFQGRFLGSELVNPDFVAFAQSCGVAAERVAAPEALRAAIDRALAADAPYVIEVTVPRGSETSPWSLLHPQLPDQTPY